MIGSRVVIEIVAPSSVVPRAELALGAQALREGGFEVRVSRQCSKKSLFFAGTHAERAEALLQAVYDSDCDIVWCARGGYGSNHLLRALAEALALRGKPPKRKLLVGSSDATSLLEFARARWGFEVLHAPMPGLRSFQLLTNPECDALCSWVRGVAPAKPFGRFSRLKWWGERPEKAIQGELVGGNLTVWNTMLGTPFQPRLSSGHAKILFLEDVTELLPRLDRAFRHLVDAGGLEGVSALVLGNFLSCEDAVPQALIKVPSRYSDEQLRDPPKKWLGPIRKRYSQEQALRAMLSELSRETGVPVAWRLPVGHGPEHFPLPLGVPVELSPDGKFTFLE
ncbi:MAG: hypothetical protein RJB38_2208 [Pseudomonadota bacterium]|jgi:muramoyltetrapeptide carboxypeptidase